MGNSSSSRTTKKASSSKKATATSTSTAIEKKGKGSILYIGSRFFRKAFLKTRKSQASTTKPDANKHGPLSNTSTNQPVNEPVNPHVFVAQAQAAPMHDGVNDTDEPRLLLRESSKRGKSERNLVIEQQEEEEDQQQPQANAVQADAANVVPANNEIQGDEVPINQIQGEPAPGVGENNAPTEAQTQQPASNAKGPSIEEQVRVVVGGIFDSWGTEDLPALKQHVIAVRKLLSNARNPPIALVRTSEVGPILVEILTKYRDIDPEIVFESLWAITNIASGTSEDTNYIVNLGVLPILSNLLDHLSHDVVEQAIWCLGNIAGDSATFRDLVLNLGINDHIARLLIVDGNKTSMRRNAAWLLSNMCRGKPEPMLNFVAPLLNIAVTYIQRQTAEDSEVLCDLLWAMSYVSTGSNDRIDAVLETGVTYPICTILLGDAGLNIVTPGIRTLGNVLSGSDTQTQVALDHGAFRVLKKHFTKQTRPALLKEILWALSNIAAGRPDQIPLLLDDEELLVSAAEVLRPKSTHKPDVKKEAMYILANLCESGTTDQVKKLATIPVVAQALFLTSFSNNQILRTLAWGAIERLIEKAGCSACVKSIMKDNTKPIQRFLEGSPLERLLRNPPMRDKMNLATLLVCLGCSPFAKVQGTNVTLLRYALRVSERTGIRLNQISNMYVLMGPVYLQGLRPKNGIWLPRELWMLFHKYYYDQNDVDIELLSDYIANEEAEDIEDLEDFDEGFTDENMVNPGEATEEDED